MKYNGSYENKRPCVNYRLFCYFCSTSHENGGVMVDNFSERTSFCYVVFEKNTILDCYRWMKSLRIVEKSRITLRCIYLSFLFSSSVHALSTYVHFYKKPRTINIAIHREVLDVRWHVVSYENTLANFAGHWWILISTLEPETEVSCNKTVPLPVISTGGGIVLSSYKKEALFKT